MAEGPTATLGIEYRERYVAFLDLLGFKVLVDAAETTLEERGRLAEVLDRLSQTLCNAPAIGGRFTYFSDCIVITADATPQGLWHVFRSIELLTRNLLQFDVFVRGAVTRGGAFHSTEYVYGTAVSRAAVLEKDEALNPLTLLSPEVLENVRKLGQIFCNGSNRTVTTAISSTTSENMRHSTPLRRYRERSVWMLTRNGSRSTSANVC